MYILLHFKDLLDKKIVDYLIKFDDMFLLILWHKTYYDLSLFELLLCGHDRERLTFYVLVKPGYKIFYPSIYR